MIVCVIVPCGEGRQGWGWTVVRTLLPVPPYLPPARPLPSRAVMKTEWKETEAWAVQVRAAGGVTQAASVAVGVVHAP